MVVDENKLFQHQKQLDEPNETIEVRLVLTHKVGVGCGILPTCRKSSMHRYLYRYNYGKHHFKNANICCRIFVVGE